MEAGSVNGGLELIGAWGNKYGANHGRLGKWVFGENTYLGELGIAGNGH